MRGSQARMPRKIVLTCLLVCGAQAWAQTIVAARMANQEWHCEAGARSQDACAQRLLEALKARAEAEFIAENELYANDAEFAELEAYQRNFEAHDRGQRARKLNELDARLQAINDPADRARLEEFRAVLVRLARYETDLDTGVEERMQVPRETMRQWIESAKLDAALYRRFGGIVGLRPSGPYAHGARVALVVQLVKREGLVFFDPEVERGFRAQLSAPPRMALSGEPPDFTPFWKRPIPASYVSD